MAKYVWGVLCQRVLIDSATNSVSYLDAVEGLRAVVLPMVALPITVATLWYRDNMKSPSLTVRVRVVDPDQQELAVSEASLTYEPQHTRGRIHIQIGGYALTRDGFHAAVIEQREGDTWVEAARLPFEIQVVGLSARAFAPQSVKNPAPARARKR